MQVVVDEAACWAAACAGDARAFARLFALHRDHVFRCALRLVRVPADADDVTAAVFLELWRRRAVVRLVEGSIRPWLLVTAGHLARNLSRGTRRWRAVLDRLPREDTPVDPADLAGQAVDVQRAATPLTAALRRLHPIDAALLTLTVFEGYPVGAAASILQLRPGTARSRLSRTRARLRIQLLQHDLDLSTRTVLEES